MCSCLSGHTKLMLKCNHKHYFNWNFSQPALRTAVKIWEPRGRHTWAPGGVILTWPQEEQRRCCHCLYTQLLMIAHTATSVCCMILCLFVDNNYIRVVTSSFIFQCAHLPFPCACLTLCTWCHHLEWLYKTSGCLHWAWSSHNKLPNTFICENIKVDMSVWFACSTNMSQSFIPEHFFSAHQWF